VRAGEQVAKAPPVEPVAGKAGVLDADQRRDVVQGGAPDGHLL